MPKALKSKAFWTCQGTLIFSKLDVTKNRPIKNKDGEFIDSKKISTGIIFNKNDQNFKKFYKTFNEHRLELIKESGITGRNNPIKNGTTMFNKALMKGCEDAGYNAEKLENLNEKTINEQEKRDMLSFLKSVYTPWEDSDVKKTLLSYEPCIEKYFMNASTNTEFPYQGKTINIDILTNNDSSTGKRVPLSSFYSGCIASIFFILSTYSGETNSGITCYLNGVHFHRNGKQLGAPRPTHIDATGQYETMGTDESPNVAPGRDETQVTTSGTHDTDDAIDVETEDADGLPF